MALQYETVWETKPAKFIILNKQFLVFNAQFLGFDTRFLVFNKKIIIFYHVCEPTHPCLA